MNSLRDESDRLPMIDSAKKEDEKDMKESLKVIPKDNLPQRKGTLQKGVSRKDLNEKQNEVLKGVNNQQAIKLIINELQKLLEQRINTF